MKVGPLLIIHSSRLATQLVLSLLQVFSFKLNLVLCSISVTQVTVISKKIAHKSVCTLIKNLPDLSFMIMLCHFILSIGVNRPAIVREIPHFGLFPAFPHFCENVPHFWLYFEITKIAKNRNNLSCTETFCSKSSAKASIIVSPSH